MRIFDFSLAREMVADFISEDPLEKLAALGIGWPPIYLALTGGHFDLIKTVIAIIPACMGVWVADRSMKRSHEYRMENLRQSRATRRPDLSPDPRSAKPGDDTVDVP